MILTFGIINIISIVTIVCVIVYSIYSSSAVNSNMADLASSTRGQFDNTELNAQKMKDIIDTAHTQQLATIKTDLDKKFTGQVDKSMTDISDSNKVRRDDMKKDYTSKVDNLNKKFDAGLADIDKQSNDLNTRFDSGITDNTNKHTSLNTKINTGFIDANNKYNILSTKVDTNKSDANSKFASVNSAYDVFNKDYTTFTNITYPTERNQLKSDILASIPITKGLTGDTGQTGVQGLKGITGDKGQQGVPTSIDKDFTKLYDFTLGDQMGGATDPRGNTGTSRALTKDNGQVLAINYQNDYKGGVRVDSKMNTKSDLDVTGNITSSGLVSSSKFNTGDVSITGTLSGASLDQIKKDVLASIPKKSSDYEAYTQANKASLASTSPNGWNVGGDSSWDPNFRSNRVGYAYNNEQNEEDASASWIIYDVPLGMKQGYLIYLAWNNCRYFDVWGINSTGNNVYIRRVNAYQGISSNSPQNMYDGVTAVSLAGVNRFKQIKLQGVKGRMNIMGIGWTTEEGRGMENGFVHYDNIIQGSSMKTPATITTGGRMNLSGGESLYVLNRNGAVVSQNAGGTGNLTVDGDTTLGGSLKLVNADVSGSLTGSAISKLNIKGAQGPTGATGNTGASGISITDISASGATLNIKTSDGKTYTVTLPTGPTGGKGANGLSIVSLTVSGNTLSIKMSDNSIQTVTIPTLPQGIQGIKGITGDAGVSAGGNTGITFNNDGTGIIWGSSVSKIYDDGNLYINTDDAMYMSAPTNLDITTPNFNLSGNMNTGAFCIGGTCVNEANFKQLLTSQATLSVLYAFTTFKFTNAGATGKTGPTLDQCVSAYSSASWAANASYLTMTTQGIQLWKVPATGSYTITVAGAIGGNSSAGPVGGNGALIVGTFNLTKNDTLKILVGQSGSPGNSGGGGGGSFVANSSDTPLIIAGGGGGSEYTTSTNTSKQASTTTTANNGIDGTSGTINGYGGTNGAGGTTGLVHKGCGAGGGGLTGNGTQSSQDTTYVGGYAGIAFTSGGQGGAGQGSGGAGGFGGGGGGEWQYYTGGGGGGGYSGGGGGSYYGCGGGGGSYNNGTNQTNTGGANNGMGYITITKN
jgi:hypothetical protein